MEDCYSAQQSNATSYGATIVAIITLEAFAGMWINAFIVCVLCIGWVKEKTLNSNEKILLFLSLSRISHLCFSWLYHFLLIIYPNYFHVHPIFQLLTFFTNFFIYLNFSVPACLCVFYCIKIANFRNKFFIYLKIKIDRMVPWLLLGSGISALAMGTIIYDVDETMQTNNLKTLRMDKHFFSAFFLPGVGYAASFTAVIFAALFLLFSLWRHKRRMQTNSTKDLSMEAHIRAMKSILSFLVMYTINFVCLSLTIIYSMKNENTMTFLIYIYLYAFPGVNSLILIFSNLKLEKALIKILPCAKCKFFVK